MDRGTIWDILGTRDIAAFLTQDWAAHLADFERIVRFFGFFLLGSGLIKFLGLA